LVETMNVRTSQSSPTLHEARSAFARIVADEALAGTQLSVYARSLSPAEAIGQPVRRDYPIIVGKERVVEATVVGARGHAFTDAPGDFTGTLSDILDLDLTSNRARAFFLAALNATLRHLGMVEGTVHCRDEDPERCAAEIAATLRARYGAIDVGLIGLNPAIADRLIEAFGPPHVRITDMNPDCIGQLRGGVEVWDGARRTDELIDAVGLVLLSGTTLTNDTFDPILERILERRIHYLVFGVTAAGVCELAGIRRICPCGRNE
jgi:hypothetical protein